MRGVAAFSAPRVCGTMPRVIGETSTPTLPLGLAEDWVQSRDLPCPTCRYNLRMLHLPRCPECGSVFRWQQLLRVHCPRCGDPLYETDGDHCLRCHLPLNWPAVLDSAAVLDRTLYEYSDRPVRAALRTCFAVLNPRAFWQRIVLEMPPAVPRLRKLRNVAIGTALSGVVLIALLPALTSARGLGRHSFALLVLTLLLPGITSLALPQFTPTLARFRIRADQLLRCLAYASTGLLWLGACFAGAFLFGWVCSSTSLLRAAGKGAEIFFYPDDLLESLAARGRWFQTWGDPWFEWFNLVLLLVWVFFGLLWWWVFLYVSLRRYLQLDRRNAVALLLSTQAIGILLLVFVLLQLGVGTSAIGEVQFRLGAFVRRWLGS
jgi:hypothetical protein